MRTKKMLLNVITDILPYIIIGVIGLVKMNVLIKYVGDVGNGYYQTINQIISYVFLAQFGFDDAVIYRSHLLKKIKMILIEYILEADIYLK